MGIDWISHTAFTYPVILSDKRAWWGLHEETFKVDKTKTGTWQLSFDQ